MTGHLYDMLKDGKRIEVARAPEVADLVCDIPPMLESVIEYIFHDCSTIVSHAAQTLKFVALKDVSLFEPYKNRLLEAASLSQWEIREQLSKFILKLSYNEAEFQQLATLFRQQYLKDKSSIVRTCALQCLFDLANENPAYCTDRNDAFRHAEKHGSKAMQARVRNLKKLL